MRTHKILNDIGSFILFFGTIGFSLYFHKLDYLLFFVIGLSVGMYIYTRS